MKKTAKTQRDRQPKRRYEPPVLVPLGEMDRGFGAACKVGSNPQGSGGLACSNGGINNLSCANGGNGPPPSLLRF